MIRRRSRAIVAAFALVSTAACVDRDTPLSPSASTEDDPGPVRTEDIAHIRCEVVLADSSVSCANVERVSAGSGPAYDRILGGQDTYVKLSSAGTIYDSGTEVFQTDVTLQNLLAQSIGTTDGSTVLGTKVFFVDGPTVTSGSGTATILNADGEDLFTASQQSYYHFNEILIPYQMSNAKTWQFSVENTVGSFTFLVFVSAPVQDDNMLLDAVWSGGWDNTWETMANWVGSIMPDSASTVSIPSDSLMSGVMPILAAADTIGNLRVGTGSEIDLNSHYLQVLGNVDAVGSVKNGMLMMTGSSTLLRGNVHALDVSGSTTLQGELTTTGPISVTGSLTTNGHPLTISIP